MCSEESQSPHTDITQRRRFMNVERKRNRQEQLLINKAHFQNVVALILHLDSASEADRRQTEDELEIQYRGDLRRKLGDRMDLG